MNLTDYYLMNFFEKFIYHLMNFFKNLPSILWIFLVKFSKGFIRFFVKFFNHTACLSVLNDEPRTAVGRANGGLLLAPPARPTATLNF